MHTDELDTLPAEENATPMEASPAGGEAAGIDLDNYDPIDWTIEFHSSMYQFKTCVFGVDTSGFSEEQLAGLEKFGQDRRRERALDLAEKSDYATRKWRYAHHQFFPKLAKAEIAYITINYDDAITQLSALKQKRAVEAVELGKQDPPLEDFQVKAEMYDAIATSLSQLLRNLRTEKLDALLVAASRHRNFRWYTTWGRVARIAVKYSDPDWHADLVDGSFHGIHLDTARFYTTS